MQLGAHTFVNGGRIRRKRTSGRGRPGLTLAERARTATCSISRQYRTRKATWSAVRRMYERIYGRTPRTLREDFLRHRRVLRSLG